LRRVIQPPLRLHIAFVFWHAAAISPKSSEGGLSGINGFDL
jgi:hypothetical protein